MNDLVHTEQCCTCSRTFVFDSNRNLWFREEDYEIYGFIWLHWDAATPAFKTDRGWCCSAECYSDHTEMTEAEEDAYMGLRLVKGGRA